tara:strand:+ start:111 stop:998 length:888 start_codon:yes stop_codon:yes gene_type:complete
MAVDDAEVRLLCIVDKKGRIQHNRLLKLQSLCKNISFSIYDLNSKFSFLSCDLVYYSHFSLFKKKPFNGPKIASITSHKCLDNMKQTIKDLKPFKAISVNNTFLLKAFKSHFSNLYYTPNGVDTKFFFNCEHRRNDKLVFGWVGNKDRSIKNYQTIYKPLKKKLGDICGFKAVASSKKDSVKDLRSAEQMRDFYHMLDCFLVTSSAEGTPNPSCEALSCGVPVITTRVGNMVEIIKDGENGFFVDDNVKSFRKKIKMVCELGEDRYKRLRKNARLSIEPWDWQYKYQAWERFFTC